MYIIPVYNTIILPGVKYNLPLNIAEGKDIETIKSEDNVILLPMKLQRDSEKISLEDFYEIGVVAEIQSIKDGTLKVITKERVSVSDLRFTENGIEGSYKIRNDINDLSEEEQALALTDIKEKVTELLGNYMWGVWIANTVKKWTSLNEAISSIGGYMNMEAPEKYRLLETDSLSERNKIISEAILEVKGLIELQTDLSNKEDDTQKKTYKEMAIRKQMTVLQKELDDMNSESLSEEKTFEGKIEESGMPEDVKKEALRVLNRFVQEGQNGHERASLYDYLDFITSLSWKVGKNKKVNLTKARSILSEEHYGMEKVKDRVLQQMAVMSLNKEQAGSILLFVGAPGTGKTSMGTSIAKALNREYVRISLGGVRDESEIRGHRRTYVGAMPGRILDGIKRSGVMNPVMVLDEIDKLGYGNNGDPGSALLEVLDPEQNKTFTDHYLNVPYDLSKVMFICTANSLDTIPRPLLDRMEVINLSGYTPIEKYHIAKEHLMPKSIEKAGLKRDNLIISDDVLKKIIDEYTMEAGVRGLKKQLDKISRQAAVKVVEEKNKKTIVGEDDLSELLGRRSSRHEKILKENIPGVVTGLAWTPVGGEILFIETTAMNGTGQIHVTGQLGDVMKESAEISVSLVKSMFYDEKLEFKDKDIHIHVPSGAVPKDGPSAGITLFTALTSLVTGVPVNPEIAMTGELSLRGQVMPIGGLPEKLMAAQRAGIKKVLIPFDNKEDLADVPKEIKELLEIVPVESIEDVILQALNIKLINIRKSFFYKKEDDFKFGISLIPDNKIPSVVGSAI